MINEIVKYKDLLFMLTWRDIRIRYKQAVMGYLWAIFMPVIAVLSGVLVKVAISMVSGKPVDITGIASIAVKVLPWTFFISAIKFGVNSLVGNSDLITKINFPREVFPLSSMLACLFDFAIATISLYAVLLVLHIGLSFNLFWMPLILCVLILFTTGISLILACANLFYRDVKYIVDVILMFGIFFTPVYYEAHTFGKWKTLLLLNPIGSILEALNTSVVQRTMPDMRWLGYAAISSTAIFFIGLWIFQKSEPWFAENI